MLMQLPDEFTYQQVIDWRVARGMDKKGTSRMLGNCLLLTLWKSEDDKVTKTESGELGSAVSAYICLLYTSY